MRLPSRERRGSSLALLDVHRDRARGERHVGVGLGDLHGGLAGADHGDVQARLGAVAVVLDADAHHALDGRGEHDRERGALQRVARCLMGRGWRG